DKVKNEGKRLEEAIRKSFAELEGNSAFVIMSKENHVIYAIKKSAPLVCAVDGGSGDVFMSSDPYALVGLAETIIFPEDAVLCIGDFRKEAHQLQFKELDGSESQRYKMQEKSMGLDVASKGGHEHFMAKEIHEQPELIKKLVSV